MKLTFFTLLLILIPSLIWSQNLTYTTSVTNNTDCGCNYNGPKVLINEFCVQPTYGNGSIYGNDGLTPIDPNLWDGEWIELYNPNPCEPSDISNYIIGTTINMNPLSFLIPPGTVIPPKGFAVIRGNKSPIPPLGTIDILINSTQHICSQNGERFWLPSESSLGGWFCLYSDWGLEVDAVKYGPQWPFNTDSPCKPPGNSVPTSTSLNSLVTLLSSAVMMDFCPMGTPPPPNPSNGQSYFRMTDGGPWSLSWHPEGSSYGSCNDPANCTQPQISCNGTASIAMTSGTPPYSYNWNTVPVQTTATATGLCAGDYCANVTDATGITQLVCITIADELFNMNGIVQQTSCGQNNGSTVFTPEGTGPFTYTWTPNVSSTNSGSNLPSGSYHVVISNGNCINDTTIVILPSIGLNISFDSIPVNCSANTGSITVNPSGGSLPYSIVWNTTETTNTISVTGNTMYSILVTDASGCSTSDTITLQAPIYPTTTLSVNDSICEGESIHLSATNVTNASFNWIGPDNFQSNQQNPTRDNATLIDSGEYILTVDLNGCKTLDTIDVIINKNPVFDFTMEVTKGCQPLEVHFDYSSAPDLTSVIWNFGDNNLSNNLTNVTHTYTGAGTYSLALFGKTAFGCSNTIIHMDTIHVYPQAEASFSVNHLTAMIDDPSFTFTNTSVNAETYLWNFGDKNSSLSFQPTHYYQPIAGYYDVILIANNEFNCPDTAKGTIEIIEPLIFYIPNTFTPDGDDYNQIFQPVFTSGFDHKQYDFKIFDRWGELVFETKDYKAGWNGHYKNRSCQDGTYIWTVTFKDSNNDKVYQHNGHVNLLR